MKGLTPTMSEKRSQLDKERAAFVDRLTSAPSSPPIEMCSITKHPDLRHFLIFTLRSHRELLVAHLNKAA